MMPAISRLYRTHVRSVCSFMGDTIHYTPFPTLFFVVVPLARKSRRQWQITLLSTIPHPTNHGARRPQHIIPHLQKKKRPFSTFSFMLRRRLLLDGHLFISQEAAAASRRAAVEAASGSAKTKHVANTSTTIMKTTPKRECRQHWANLVKLFLKAAFFIPTCTLPFSADKKLPGTKTSNILGSSKKRVKKTPIYYRTVQQPIYEVVL